MRIALTGSSGLLGRALASGLEAAGHTVCRLVRRSPAGPDAVAWDPAGGVLRGEELAGVGAVIHLGGEPIAGGRWTSERKRRIRDSRVDSTRLLSEVLGAMPDPPETLMCASAVGYYGDRGDEVLTESATRGSGFLAEVCGAWEAAADRAREAGLRVTHLRFGVVLSAEGGALAKMLTPFRLGAGGALGSGRQYMSWIGLDDAVASMLHVLTDEATVGPVNVVSPKPVTNAEFTRCLGRVLGRPAVMPVPAFALRLAFGEMADETLLASQRAVPRCLEARGFTFRAPGLDDALRAALARS